MLLNKYDVEKNGYIDYFLLVANFHQFKGGRGGGPSTMVFSQNIQFLSNLKLIFLKVILKD
jgi:hypothetical protein